MKKLCALMILLLVGMAASPVLAGVVITMETNNSSGKTVDTMQLHADGSVSSIRMGVAGKDRTEMVFKGDEQTMLTVDHSKKSYMEIDQETVEKMAVQINQMAAQMEEALKNGTLIEVLPGHTALEFGLYALYPHRRYLSKKIRCFIEFMQEHFS